MDGNRQAYFIHIWLNKYQHIALLFKKINIVPKRKVIERSPVLDTLCRYSAGQ